MQTETVSPRSRGLDTWSGAEILEALLEGQLAAVAAVRAVLPALDAAAAAAVARLRRGGRLVYVGAGTSGRIAIQDGVELTPTFSWPAERLVFLMAGGEPALLHAAEGAEDDAAAAEAAIDRAGVGPDDVVVGLAASGGTPYTVAAVRRARARGALTLGVANNPGAPLLEAAEHPLLLATGPEAIAGSTRMKAGTAQKVLANLFSTLVMVKLGRVHDGYMVDLRATNRKLVRRSLRMLMQLTGVGEAAAQAALDACRGRVKPAVLVLRGLTAEAAEAALEQAGGSLRAALAGVDHAEPPLGSAAPG